ncbi:hypothetical protein IVA77_18820 [Bradyrhizobium sp. 136]|nr:hypothetical protein [Bradyrhizobium sp. 163]MCK1763560.1 hypothetical protein [Bradyrhizobium sp. 136]
MLTAPLALTVPVTPWPMTLPEETTTAPDVVPPQPTLTTIQAPSKLPPPPPPPRREELRGSSAGLLRRAEGGRLGGTIRPRAGQRFLVIADRAAGAAGLRNGGRWSADGGQEDGQGNRRDDGAHE